MKDIPFHLPLGISCQEEKLPGDNFAYIIHHPELKEVGQFYLIRENGMLVTSYEVAGEMEDPLYEKRQGVMEVMAGCLKGFFGGASHTNDTDLASQITPKWHSIKFECFQCNSVVGKYLLCSNPVLPSDLEDLATEICALINLESKSHVWVVGEQKGKTVVDGNILALKVWPLLLQRNAVQCMSLEELHATFKKLQATHCF